MFALSLREIYKGIYILFCIHIYFTIKNFLINKSKGIIIRNIKLCKPTRIRMILFIRRNFRESIQGIRYPVNRTNLISKPHQK